MTLICAGTIGSGLLLSKGLLAAGMDQPALRYVLAVLFSYLTFFGFVFLWIRWHFHRARKRPHGRALDALDFVDLPFPGGSSPSAPAPESWGGGGGKFGGGGASSSWDGPAPVSKGGKLSGKAGSKLFDSLGDSDDLAVILLVLALVLVICGSAFFLVYYAPEILLEAAFESILVAGLVKKARNTEIEGWASVILRQTWFYFAAVLVIAFVLGHMISANCPGAKSFAEYRAVCMKR